MAGGWGGGLSFEFNEHSRFFGFFGFFGFGLGLGFGFSLGLGLVYCFLERESFTSKLGFSKGECIKI